MADADPLPLVRPMLASPGELPPPEQEQRWAFEMKWDGVRAVVYLDRGDLRMLTRNDREVARDVPGAGRPGRRSCAPTGSCWTARSSRSTRPAGPASASCRPGCTSARPGRALLDRVPVSLLVFDLLHLDGDSLVARRTTSGGPRSRHLDLAGDRWAIPPAFDGQRRGGAGRVKAQGLEGVLAKRHDSVYLPGRRSPHWIKVKHVRMQEVVVGGWSPGAGRRQGGIGSLLLGVPDEDGRLVYAGHVGTGFSDRVLADLGTRLRAAERTHVAVRRRGAARPREGRALGDPAAGRRGDVLGVDPGRDDAAPVLARAAARQGPPGRTPGELTGQAPAPSSAVRPIRPGRPSR